MDKDIPREERMPVFLAEIAFDGYTWNRHAEHLGRDGEWRLRSTSLDNAPSGREVHWNSAFAWYLRGLGEVYRAINGESLRNSIFRMSIWANPIILTLAIAIFSTMAARRFGQLAGAVIAAGMVAVPTFYEGFMPGYPDHHGLIAFSLLGMVFGIAWGGAGWVQSEGGRDFASPRSREQARRGMILSAICGSVGLWISALSMALVLAAVGVAALTSCFVISRRAPAGELHFDASLWRTWALWGAGGSFFFYLLEYFPNHMGMRMEVNHPFYAVAWLGGGWAISILCGWLTAPPKAAFPWTNLILPVLACAILPLTVVFGGSGVYTPRDEFVFQLHKHIAEFLPLITRISHGGLTWAMAFGWFPILIVAALGLLFLKRVGTGTKAVLIFLSAPIFLLTALQFYQVRWGMLAGPLYIALAAIVIPTIWRLAPRSLSGRLSVALPLLVIGYLFVQPSFNNSFSGSWTQFKKGNDETPISYGQGLALLHRQMARTIRDSAGEKPVVLLSSPNSSCMLSALGGFQTVGTLYWENAQGLKHAAAALNAQSDSEALARIRELGVTHVSLMTWENFIAPFFFILHPEPVRGKNVRNSFALRALEGKQIPVWTRPLIFPPNDLSRGLQQQILLLQVAPEQGGVEAKFHIGRFARFVEGNPVAAEMAFKEILEVDPRRTSARIELADLFFAQKRNEEAMAQILKALPDSDPGLRSAIARKFVPILAAAENWKMRSELAKAIAAFDDADAEALENAAWILSTAPDAEDRDAQLALAYCDRMEKLPHDRKDLLLARAAALAAAGDLKKATLTAREAAALDPADQALQARALGMCEAFEKGTVSRDSR